MVLFGRSDLVTGRLMTSSNKRAPSGGRLNPYRFLYLERIPGSNFVKLKVSTKYDILNIMVKV